MQQIYHHPHHPPHGLLRESDQYMPGHGLGSHTGNEPQVGRTVNMFLVAFWFSLLMSIPVLVWDPSIQASLGYQVRDFIGEGLTPAIFGLAVFYYGGQIFFRGAYRELRDYHPGVMVLNSLAITLAFIYSAMVTFGFPGQPLWVQLALMVTILLLGNWIDMRAITQAERKLQQLRSSLPEPVLHFISENRVTEITQPELRVGQLLLIEPGDIFPADGVVRSGSSRVDESMLTGTAELIIKQSGDKVLAGTSNGEKTLNIEITATGDNTVLMNILRTLKETLESRSRAQSLADRAAYFLTLATIAITGVTLLLWMMMGASLTFTVTRAVSVLVIASPQALGLAIPLVFALTNTIGLRHGLLVRDRRGMDDAKEVNLVIFDTGTLTQGRPQVTEMVAINDLSSQEALRLANTVVGNSDHPIAQAFHSSVHSVALPQPATFDWPSLQGYDAQATVDNRPLSVCGTHVLRERNLALPAVLAQASERFETEGAAVCYLLDEQQPLAVFAIADPVRAESAEAIERLHAFGIEVGIFTSDAEKNTEYLTRNLNLDIVYDSVPAEQKSDKICQLQKHGKRVAVVGAGRCDAMAMMVADVAIALGVGADQSNDSADITTMRTDPRDAARIIQLSKAAYHRVIENIGWAAGYNLIAIPLATGVMIGSGILLSPVVAALLMSGSALIVAINAQRLQRMKL